MSFVFRYQKVLEVRDRQQRVLEVELGRASRAVLDAQSALARWQRRRHGVLDLLGEARAQGDLEQNARCTAYLRHVRGRLGRCRAALAGLQAQKEAARERLLDAMKARKALETYREKLRAQYVAAQHKAEERAIDLHSTRAFARSEGTL